MEEAGGPSDGADRVTARGPARALVGFGLDLNAGPRIVAWSTDDVVAVATGSHVVAAHAHHIDGHQWW